VWAIGTGKVATPAIAQDVHATIRAWLSAQYGADAAQQVRTIVVFVVFLMVMFVVFIRTVAVLFSCWCRIG